MVFTQQHRLDLVNRLVIFEAVGHVDHVDKMAVSYTHLTLPTKRIV